MLALSGKQLFRKVVAGTWRTFGSEVDQPYWRSKFPDRIATFDEIPTVPNAHNYKDYPKVAEGWFKEHGHVVKEVTQYGAYSVHLFHFDDFRTVYANDGKFPIRHSHQVIAQYRQERKHLYDHVGLGPGQGTEWEHLRSIVLQPFIHATINTEDIMDDLLNIIKSNLNDKGEIELLPWLHRWNFESIGKVALNRRLNALSKSDKLADKMVEASALTDEIIALTTLDPKNNYAERYRQLAEAQDFFHGVLRRYVDDIKVDIALDSESEGMVHKLLENEKCSENDAITLIIDLFHGSLTTVPLVALMTLYHVARNNNVQAQAREELKAFKESESVRTPPYIRSIIYETLRLTPPIIGNGRIIQKELVLGGYLVPAYTNVILDYQVACRQEENFKEPLKFIPGRPNINVYRYIFGGSGRVCLGNRFAHRQLNDVITKVLENFEVFYDGDEVKTITKLHNLPDKPLILRLKPIED